eukprot:2189770-Prymnesium_polylepis.1
MLAIELPVRRSIKLGFDLRQSSSSLCRAGFTTPDAVSAPSAAAPESVYPPSLYFLSSSSSLSFCSRCWWRAMRSSLSVARVLYSLPTSIRTKRKHSSMRVPRMPRICSTRKPCRSRPSTAVS